MSGTGYPLFPHSSDPEEEHHHLMNQPEIDPEEEHHRMDIHRIPDDKINRVISTFCGTLLVSLMPGVGLVWCMIPSVQVCRCGV